MRGGEGAPDRKWGVAQPRTERGAQPQSTVNAMVRQTVGGSTGIIAMENCTKEADWGHEWGRGQGCESKAANEASRTPC